MIQNKSFYERREWQETRYKVLRSCGEKCGACNRTRSDGVILHVDHIKPISIYPELALTESNLQVLCADCNLGKSNKFSDDFRGSSGIPNDRFVVRPAVDPRPAPKNVEEFLARVKESLATAAMARERA